MKKLLLITALALLAFPASAESVDSADGEVETITAEIIPAPKPAGPITHIGEMVTYKAKNEDTLVALARENGLGFVEMRAANPNIDPWLPGAGTKITIPGMHLIPDAQKKGIIINLPEMRLYYFPEDGEPKSYSIGIGREGLLTPTGTTHIRAKKEKPTWRPTKRMREEDPELPRSVPPGTNNPLGEYILYLGWPEYGIHGTNKPYGIGRRVSSGCIRMYPESIEELFALVPEKTPVAVVNQPVKIAWIDDKLYMEAHPTMSQADAMEIDGRLPDYDVSHDEIALIMEKAGLQRSQLDWQTIREVIKTRNGYPIIIAERPGDEKDTSPAKTEERTKTDEPS